MFTPCRVSDHVEIFCIEQVDELTRWGIIRQLMGSEFFCGMWLDVCKDILNESDDEERQILFSNQIILRQSKLLLRN